MEDKILKESNIPMGYELCFNGGCADKDTCMHYQAMLLTSADRYKGNAVFPTAWQDGKCRCYHEKKLVKKAWGFTNLYNNVPHYARAVARSYVRGFWGVVMASIIELTTAKYCYRPNSRRKYYRLYLNSAPSTASNSTAIKQIGTSNKKSQLFISLFSSHQHLPRLSQGGSLRP